MDQLLLPHGITITMFDDVGTVSDGYHTFNELYAHRFALFLALCRAMNCGWKSQLHADGTSYEGWFIVGLTLPNVGDISYHVPLAMWDQAAHLTTLVRAPSWDGHTAANVVEHLTIFATLDVMETQKEHP